ncbi:Gem-associated protein 2 [Aphelenchoides bicaudatus]|nr:Gem-associated protein 2 [Aphelenchoides bicaudatus]
MEQQAIIDVGDFNRSEIDLNKPANDAAEYIKQVIVGREQCPDVVVANVDRSKFKKPTCLVPTDASASAVCSFTPSVEWSQLKVDNFTLMRTIFEEKRDLDDYETNVKFPSANDAQNWISFCLAVRSQELDLDESLVETFAHHQGTPPILTLVLAIPDNSINFALLHLTSYFIEKGYTRALAEWIFSLLLAVRKPLIHDVCNSLRQLARYCRVERSKLDADQMPLIREYTFFIAIISLYFGQKDLCDK